MVVQFCLTVSSDIGDRAFLLLCGMRSCVAVGYGGLISVIDSHYGDFVALPERMHDYPKKKKKKKKGVAPGPGMPSG
jgi:hypothetical protein